jgi:hypothetical protein
MTSDAGSIYEKLPKDSSSPRSVLIVAHRIHRASDHFRRTRYFGVADILGWNRPAFVLNRESMGSDACGIPKPGKA